MTGSALALELQTVCATATQITQSFFSACARTRARCDGQGRARGRSQAKARQREPTGVSGAASGHQLHRPEDVRRRQQQRAACDQTSRARVVNIRRRARARGDRRRCRGRTREVRPRRPWRAAARDTKPISARFGPRRSGRGAAVEPWTRVGGLGGLRASERGGGCAQVNWGGLRASEGQDIANAGHETVDEMDGQQGVQGVPRLRQALQRRDGPAPPLPRLRPPRLQALLARARRAGRALLHPLRDQIHAAGLDRVQAQGLPRRDGRGAAALGADLGPRPPASFRSAPLLGPRRLVRSPRGCFSDESRRRRGRRADIPSRWVAATPSGTWIFRW